MKNILIKIIFFTLPIINASAQNVIKGVYLTYSDYLNHKLSYEIDCKTEKHAIKINEFFNYPHITIKHEGKKIVLHKDSIYGILDCDSELSRFQNNVDYTLIEKGATWIYYTEVGGSVETEYRLQKKYYFSKNGSSDLEELTIKNIKAAFIGNPKLCVKLDAEIKNDADIYSYDSIHKMYKINYILNYLEP